MAIDTAAKRRSVSGAGWALLGPGVTPNATPDQAWRQMVGWGYSGILAEVPTTGLYIAENRRSVAGVPFFILGPGITPSASPTATWRQASGWSYAGIQADVPPTPTPPTYAAQATRRRLTSATQATRLYWTRNALRAT